MKLKEHDVAAGLALQAILHIAQHNELVEALLQIRIKALLAAGKNEEALSASKSLFNAATMAKTSDAIKAVTDCLKAARPDEKGIVQRFKLEQLAEAPDRKAPTAEPNAAKDGKAEPRAKTVLESIMIDEALLGNALENVKMDTFENLNSWGNLLLISGNAKDAQAVFEKAYKIAPEDKLPLATENLARVMRAQDGNVSRANAWILSVRPTNAQN
jgi:tetratricopeptide (TPR) repeat protein